MLEIKTIKVDRDVYSELIKRIQDFNDTPNSVLRRVFNIECLSQEKRQTKGSLNSKNIIGRIEGDKQRIRLKKKYGTRIENYPLLYHAGWPLEQQGQAVQKYSFGISWRRFVEQKIQGGFVVFICGRAEETFFIPCQWIENHLKPLKQPAVQLKFNIPVAGEDYYWMNKKDGIVINCFKNNLP